MANEPNINLDEVKNILHNYNLLDDYFFEGDLPTSTGEIISTPSDAGISVNKKFKDVTKQINLMRSAVDKIYKGYLSAYSKDSYKAQFDIYPMRDFDEHMADLGAKRSSNGIDFEPVGNPVDWVAKVKTEIKSRLAERTKLEEEAKQKALDEQVDKQITSNLTTDKTKDNNFELDFEAAKKYLTDNFKDKPLNPVTFKGFDEYLRKFISTGEVTGSMTAFDTDTLIKMRKSIANKSTVKEAQDALNQRNEANAEINKDKEVTKNKINETQKLLEERKKALENPDLDVREKNKITSDIEDLTKKLNDANKRRSALVKGTKISNEELNKYTKEFSTPYEREINKTYDGFTTVGPFCKQKRDYFRNVYRPSIDHFDTEFREAIPTPVKVKDVGNDIIKTIHPKGFGPKDVANLNNNEEVSFTPIGLSTETVNPLKTGQKLTLGANNWSIPDSPTGVLSFKEFCYKTNNVLDIILANKTIFDKQSYFGVIVNLLKKLNFAVEINKTVSIPADKAPELVNFLINDTSVERNKLFGYIERFLKFHEHIIEGFDNGKDMLNIFYKNYNIFIANKKIGATI